MEKPRHIPERKCSGCGEVNPKRGLIRVVRKPDGTVAVDPGGKVSGRGAYLCRDAVCLAKAIKTRKLPRSLKVEVPAEIYATVEAMIKEGATDGNAK